MDIRELKQEKADLIREGGEILGAPAGENGALSPEQAERHDAILARLGSEDTPGTLLAEIQRYETQGNLERMQAGAGDYARPQVTRVHDNAADRAWTSFGEFLQAVANVEMRHVIDPRLYGAATGMGESVPAEGGFLVQSDFSTELLQRARAEAVLAPRCRTIPISAASNSLNLPTVDETSRATGSRWGGVQTYWNDEGTAPTATKPKFAFTDIKLQRLTGLAYATDELLQDAVALEAIISMAFGEELAAELDDKIVNGDGAGRPLGILNADCLVSVAKESGQTAATIVFENIVKMWSRMWARSRPRAIWMINQDTEPQLFSMSLAVGTGGVPVYLPANGLSESPYAMLMGRPVVPVEHCPTLGTVGDIILGDLSQYLLIEKGGLQADSSMHVRFTQHEMTYRFMRRVNGQPIWSSALTPAKGSNTLSPFVALATRA